MSIFDSVRDKVLIAAGTHFYCHAHLTAQPISEQSAIDPQYCRSCFSLIDSERKSNNEDKRNRDSWEGNIFNHFGKKYGVNDSCQTIWVGDDVQESLTVPKEQTEQATTKDFQGKRILNIGGTKNVTDNCIVCGSPVNSKRSDGKYCSNKCKQKHYRGKQLSLAGVN